MNWRRYPESPSLEQVRDEFARNGSNRWIWEWMFDTLEVYAKVRLTRRYPPALYSPSGNWDRPGISDLVNGFISEWAMKGKFVLAISRAQDTGGLTRYFEAAFRNYVVSRREPSATSNVYERLREALARDPELRALAGAGSRTAYGDYQWVDSPPLVATDEDLRRASRYLPAEIPFAEYRTGTRQSPVLATATLREIARAVIRGTQRLMTAGQIIHVIRLRVNLNAAAGEEVGGYAQIAIPDSAAPDPLESVFAQEQAHRVLAALSDRQKQILRIWCGGARPLTVREIAAQLACGKTLIHDEQERIKLAFRALDLTRERERDQVISSVLQILEDAYSDGRAVLSDGTARALADKTEG